MKLALFLRIRRAHAITRRLLATTGSIDKDGNSESPSSVRVRFAPSPTGFVHIGGLRTIVYNYLFARSHPQGRFILRIEDTDQDRIVPGAADALESTMAWLGMEADESPLKGGPVGPYVQSQRLQLYQEAVKALMEKGRAYRCFCSADRLMIMKKEALKNRESVRYDNTCRSLAQEEIDSKLASGVPFTIRFLLENEPYPLMDTVYGRYEYRVDIHEGDPVIMKTTGFPTYHLANVVDDHHMRISHVIRGEEWLQSTPKHLQMYAALDWKPPIFAHLPLMMGKKGAKLSKRDSAANLDTYRRSGYYPLPLINFVLSTGGGFDQKVKDKNRLYSLDELRAMFNLDSLSTRPTKIEPEFLDKYNMLYMKTMTKSMLVDEMRKVIMEKVETSKNEDLQQEVLDDEYLTRILDQYSIDDRTATLVQLLEHPDHAFLWSHDISIHPDLLKSITQEGTLITTAEMITTLESMIKYLQDRFIDPDHKIEDVKRILSDFIQLHGLHERTLLPFIRLLITNNKKGLPIAEMFYLLGKDRVIRRLQQGIARLKDYQASRPMNRDDDAKDKQPIRCA